jgi:hypothetical protein
MKLLALWCAGTLAASSIAMAQSLDANAATGETAAPPRVEARSADLLAVGIVHADRLTIHLSRLIDNAPVRDVAVTVLFRGIAHPTTAATDGSFTLRDKDLTLPGAAAVEFQIVGQGIRETLEGTLQLSAPTGASDDKNSVRQMGWWVLNFAVCIGFLLLLSRRRKAADS